MVKVVIRFGSDAEETLPEEWVETRGLDPIDRLQVSKESHDQ